MKGNERNQRANEVECASASAIVRARWALILWRGTEGGYTNSMAVASRLMVFSQYSSAEIRVVRDVSDEYIFEASLSLRAIDWEPKACHGAARVADACSRHFLSRNESRMIFGVVLVSGATEAKAREALIVGSTTTFMSWVPGCVCVYLWVGSGWVGVSGYGLGLGVD